MCNAQRSQTPQTQAVPADSSATTVAESITLQFWGDMMMHDTQILAAYDSTSETYNYEPCFDLVRNHIKKADVAICNFECTLGGKPYKGYPCFSAPDSYLDALCNAGFDIFLTANNHCLDMRRKGLERTIEMMKQKNVLQLGTYTSQNDRNDRYPIIIEVKGVKIAMLNYTYGTNGIKPQADNIVNYTDTAIIRNDIKEARRKGADYIIANMHWGVELDEVERKDQVQLARWLIENDVDHIIGGHPHVVQHITSTTSFRKPDSAEHLIAYSLGNVLSNMQNKGGDGGIVLNLSLPIDKKKTFGASYSIYHIARPATSGVDNFIIVPCGYEGDIPEAEKLLLEEFSQSAREKIAQKAIVKEEIMQP